MTAIAETATEPDFEISAPRVREDLLYILDGRIEKANRRLAKAGVVERFSYTASDRELVEEYVEGTDLIAARYFTVAVELSVPVIGIAGWTFVATLSFEDAGTIVRTVPGQECSFRPADRVCDHCHTDRYRNETFVVRNDETGEFKQLGRNCLELFFGIKPSVWVFEQTFGLGDSDDEIYSAGALRISHERVTTIVAAALGCTNGGLGYVSKAAAEFNGEPTSSATYATLYERPFGRYADERKVQLDEWRAAATRFEAEGLVAKVVDAALAIEGASEYAENIRILAACEFVDLKNLGFVASFVSVYAREQIKVAQAKARAEREASRVESTFIGAVGDKKVATSGVVTGQREIEGDYGTTTLVEWTTSEGDVCKWFASNRTFGDDLLGSTVEVVGTIKKHETYNGRKATLFTRCKLEVA